MTDPTHAGTGIGLAPIIGIGALGAVLFAGAVAFLGLRGEPTVEEAEQPSASVAAVEAPEAPEGAAPPEAPSPATATPDLAETVTTELAAAPETDPAPIDPPPPMPPQFDLVRVDPAGNAVIAGQAGASAEVTLSIDGTPVEIVTADAGGQFVALLTLPPADAPRVLTMTSVMPDGASLGSEQSVIIAPFTGEMVASAMQETPQDPPLDVPQQSVPEMTTQQPSEAVAERPQDPDPVTPEDTSVAAAQAEAEPDTGLPPDPPPTTRTDAPGIGEATSTPPRTPGGDGDAAPAADGATALAAAGTDATPVAETTTPTAPDAAPDASTPPQAPAAAEITAAPSDPAPDTMPQAPATAPEAPAVLLADRDGIRVLQAPGAPPNALTELQLDTISYDLAGEVTLAGRGPAESSVRVTLNNQPINLGEIGPGGQWSLDLPDVDPGTYTLRVEEVSSDGSVASEIETPFLREDPDRIRDNPMLVDPGASVITVQRGFTLWGIAEANFGEGVLYVQIFAENRAEIRDPDLIFPGQIFALPDLPRGTGE